MKTRKEKLEAAGWKVVAEKKDKLFIADDPQKQHRWLLRFRGGNHPTIPKMVVAYYPSIADQETRFKLYNNPKAVLDMWDHDGMHYGEFIAVWTVPETKLI